MPARTRSNLRPSDRARRERIAAANPHPRLRRPGAAGLGLAGAALALGAAAAYVQLRARQAERSNPPAGRFVEVDGVRLHYLVRGSGPDLVLLHGNGALFRDFELSGLVRRAARTYRVTVFDRPGYGYSSRPRSRIWTPAAQARLLRGAFAQLGLSQPVVLGHSWGAMVALALGLDHPLAVKSLVLMSGYYHPTLRADVPLLSPPAIPVLGDLMRFTVSPPITRLVWPLLVKRLFAPDPVPKHFARFPKWMALRPGQIRASAAETAMMVPAAMQMARRYRRLAVPAVVIGGAGDRIVGTGRQSEALSRELPDAALRIVPRAGHMLHHVAPDAVLAAIDEAARLGEERQAAGAFRGG